MTGLSEPLIALLSRSIDTILVYYYAFNASTPEWPKFCYQSVLVIPSRPALLIWPRYENLPDPETDASLPVVTITDFASGEVGKEVILLVAGEHARELITSEIVFWLGKLLSGQDDELADWTAVQTATALAWKRDWAKGTLKEWAEDLLGKVIFKVGHRSLKPLKPQTSPMRPPPLSTLQ
jgi:hypothetical protein